MIRSLLKGKAMPLFLISIFFSWHGYAQCGLDIYIANDQSGSVDTREDMQSRQFIERLSLAFSLGNGNAESRIAIASWSWSDEFEPYNFPSAGAGYTILPADIIAYRNSTRPFTGGTDPYTAILEAWQNINVTPVPGRNVSKVIVLMTDAYAEQVNPGIISLANQVKATGVRIVVMGIDAASGNPPQNILQNVASPGMNFTASSYTDLIDNALGTIQAINTAVCPAPPITFDLTVAINTFDCNSGQVSYKVSNAGNQSFGPATLNVSFYAGNPFYNTASLVTTHAQPAITLAAGSSATYTYSNSLLTGARSLYAVVNLDTAGTNAVPPLPYDLSAKLLVAGEYNSLNNFSSVYTTTGCVKAVIDVRNTGAMGCNNTANYQVQVCNTGSANATIESLTSLTPAGFNLLSTQVTASPAGCNSIAENIQRNWGTYFGGTGSETVMDVVADASGNVYIAGYTTSSSNIATAGVSDNSYNGSTDGFVAKFNAAGVLQWGTYIGGTGTDNIQRMAVDNSGNVYVSGYSASTAGIASAGAYQTSRSGSEDAFLIKLNGTNGTRLWGTYYGDNSNSANETNALVTVSGSDVYIAMRTSTGSSNLTTNGTTHIGGVDVVLVKFNSAGTRIWATLWGGTNDEQIGFGEIIADASGLYFGGSTYSTSGIAFGNYWDNTHPGGRVAFLSRFDPATGNKVWAGYLDDAGSSSDVTQIHIENATNLVVTTVGSAAKLYRFSVNGGAPLLSSAPITGGIHKMVVDASGTIYTGLPTTQGGLGTSGAYQEANAGATDILLRIYSSSFALRYATYYGDTGNEVAVVSLAIDASANIFLTGATTTNPSTVLASPGAHQTASAGSNQAILAKFAPLKPRGVLPAGCCVLLNYVYDASTAASGTYNTGFDVSATKVLPSDSDPVMLPNSNFAVPGYAGAYNGFDGAANTTDDVIKTGSPCVASASPVTMAVSLAAPGSCSQSFGTATITINNPNTGISFYNKRLLLNLTGTGSVFSGEPYDLTSGLQLQSPDISNPDYSVPGIEGQLNGKNDNQYLTIYSLPPGTSTFKIDVALGTAATNIAATVLDLPAFYNSGGTTNTATGAGWAASPSGPVINLTYPGSIDAGSTISVSATTTGAAMVQWVSATTGNLTNSGTIAMPQIIYTPSATDIAAGYADISLTAVSAAGCDNLRAFRVIINNVARDYGDAPTSYDLGQMQLPVAAASTGLTGLYLGLTDPDTEPMSQPSVTCHGDGNEEDGLRGYGLPLSGQTDWRINVQATNNAAAQAYLVAYIDWNYDGDFLDANEQSSAVTVPSLSGTAIYQPVFTVPVMASPDTYMRLRISTDQPSIKFPYGASPEGEVEDYLVSINVPLTVRLNNFNAVRDAAHVLLSWETSAEIINDHFDIERSSNGTGNWQKIGEVNGYGNSTQLHSYRFIDRLPHLTTNYYRLRQVDTEGRLHYSPVRLVTFSSKEAVYPNPVKDQLFIGADSHNNRFNVVVTSTSGEQLLQKNNITSGSAISMTSLPSGVYVVKVLSGDNSARYFKIVKQ